MKCPYCGSLKDKVTDSRATEDNTEIRRRRECLDCHRRFTTYERLEEMPLIVIKKDGSSQTFDRDKLILSIMKSCVKRPISTKTIESIVDRVESEARNAFKREITSRQIGESVLAQLRNIDDVAYIRFASVYRDFDNVESFLRELKDLKQDNV